MVVSILFQCQLYQSTKTSVKIQNHIELFVQVHDCLILPKRSNGRTDERPNSRKGERTNGRTAEQFFEKNLFLNFLKFLKFLNFLLLKPADR